MHDARVSGPVALWLRRVKLGPLDGHIHLHQAQAWIYLYVLPSENARTNSIATFFR